ISALREIWLPAAFAPAEIVETTANLTWNAESGSLTVANDIPTSDGVDYSIVSSVPRFTTEELRAAPRTVPSEIRGRYLPLPTVPDLVRTEAQRVTAGATTQYDQMIALQEYFRSFDYSVDLPPNEGLDPLEHFLNTRVGFCQQFAGTFAVMARVLNIPARVAIGFTWGDPIAEAEDGRTIYQVTGRQAHAWPEVWFDGLGWVAFEPTPGRGAPAAVEYTGVAASQDSLIQPDNPDGPVTTTTAAPSVANPIDPGLDIPEIDVGGQGSGQGAADQGGLSLTAVLWVLGIAGVLAAYFGGLPAYHWFRRQQRRQRVDSPSRSVETAWAEVTETLELGFGLTRRPSETRREYAYRLASDMRVPRPAMGQLADKATIARYYPAGLSEADALRADELAGEIEESVNTRVPAWARWKRLVDPRRVLKPSARIAVTSPLPERRGTPNGSHPRQPVG
ncbi:MAG: transglutaminase domain-containing protein, partial [Acidimicrobiia bacterium]|nr:transglutaminase domain-containing protein [Acidimicrobiia bacterium]